MMQHYFPITQNGRSTRPTYQDFVTDKTACVYRASNNWSSTENSTWNNSWNINFNNGNINNNNKYNDNNCRALVEFSEQEKIDWVLAYVDCCRSKMTTKQCTEYRMYAEEDLFILASQVKSRCYLPLQSVTFMVTKPKLREIFAAHFRDRIVQHWIIMKINPLIEQKFHQQGDVSYNCRKNFGTLKAIQNLEKGIEEVTQNYTKEAVIGKYDFKSFFMTINLDILWNKIEQFIRENYKGNDIEDVLYATKVTVYHRPQDNCVKRGVDLWDQLDASKSLFNIKDKHGMPIGNITSQILANFYMSFFDQEVIDYCNAHGGYYIRFVDDFIIVLPTVKELLEIERHIREWLPSQLEITIHKDKVYIQPARNGVKFIGSIIRPHRIYLANRTYGGFSTALLQAELVCKRITPYNFRKYTQSINHIYTTINSYLGFTRHNKSYNKKRSMFIKCDKLWNVFDIDSDLTTLEMKRQYKLKNTRYEQYRKSLQY